MKHTLLLFATALLLGIQGYAQTVIAINTTGNEPDTSAMLGVGSTEKGFLIRRMTQTRRTAIAAQKLPLLTKAQAYTGATVRIQQRKLER